MHCKLRCNFRPSVHSSLGPLPRQQRFPQANGERRGNDFGVKYEGREHAEHLASVLKKFYNVTEEWKGDRYIGIDLD